MPSLLKLFIYFFSYCGKIQHKHFKVCSSVASGTFTHWCSDHPLSSPRTFLSPPEETPYSLSNTPLFALFSSPWQPPVCFLSWDLPILDISKNRPLLIISKCLDPVTCLLIFSSYSGSCFYVPWNPLSQWSLSSTAVRLAALC